MDKVWNQQEFEEMMLIENFLKNNLNREDTQKIEEKIAGDPLFAATIEEEKILMEGLMGVHSVYLEKKVRTWSKATAKEKQPRISLFKKHTSPYKNEAVPVSDTRPKIRFWLNAAATLALLATLSISAYYVYNWAQYSPTEIYEREYRTMRLDAGDIVSRAGTSMDKQSKDLRQKGFNFYYKKNYAEAAKLLSQIPDDETSLFYLAMSKMELEDYEGASQNLEKYLTSYESYEIEAQWFLALAWIRLEKIDKARKMLLNLSVRKNKYKERAESILKELD